MGADRDTTNCVQCQQLLSKFKDERELKGTFLKRKGDSKMGADRRHD